MMDEDKFLNTQKNAVIGFGMSEREADKHAKQTLKLAKDLAEFNKTDIDTQMRKFDGRNTTGNFKGLEKFGVYPDK